MNNRVKIIEDNLNVKLPLSYQSFINDIGLISDENGEIFGYIENIEIDKIPCVIGATKLYKEDYKTISDKEIVINFDDLKNNPITLNTDNENIYSVEFDKKTKIDSSFKDWLEKKLEESKWKA